MSLKKLIARSQDELPRVAEELLSGMTDHRVFAIKGSMGAGKTTLIKALCDHLGVQEVVSSPTFSLVNEYSSRDGRAVYHFDFYRIHKIEEVFDIGYEEYFYSGDYCFIEWPELVESLLPDLFVEVHIEVGPDEVRTFSCNISKTA